MNRGVLRDSSSSELIRLFQHLRTGHEINIVTFYNGFIEVASNEERMLGRIRGHNRYRDSLLSQSHGFYPIKQALEKIVRDHSALYKIVRFFIRGARSSATTPGPEQQNRLANETFDSYLNTVGSIEQLSKSDGFQHAVCWQPMPYQEPFLTEGERPGEGFSCKIPGWGTEEPVTFDEEGAEHFNASDALCGRDVSVYVDIGH